MAKKREEPRAEKPIEPKSDENVIKKPPIIKPQE